MSLSQYTDSYSFKDQITGAYPTLVAGSWMERGLVRYSDNISDTTPPSIVNTTWEYFPLSVLVTYNRWAADPITDTSPPHIVASTWTYVPLTVLITYNRWAIEPITGSTQLISATYTGI